MCHMTRDLAHSVEPKIQRSKRGKCLMLDPSTERTEPRTNAPRSPISLASEGQTCPLSLQLRLNSSGTNPDFREVSQASGSFRSEMCEDFPALRPPELTTLDARERSWDPRTFALWLVLFTQSHLETSVEQGPDPFYPGCLGGCSHTLIGIRTAPTGTI